MLLICIQTASHQDGCAAQRILYNPAQPVNLTPGQEQGPSLAAQQALGDEVSKYVYEQPVEGPAEKGKKEQTDILDQLMLDGAVQDPQPGGMDALSADQPAGESVCHVSKPACIPRPDVHSCIAIRLVKQKAACSCCASLYHMTGANA